MMKTYARIDNGSIAEVIPPVVYEEDDPLDPPSYKAGDEVPIEKRYTPEFVATFVDITDLNPMPGPNWSYRDGKFAPYQPPLPTEAEISANNSAMLLQANRIAAAQPVPATPAI